MIIKKIIILLTIIWELVSGVPEHISATTLKDNV